MAGNFPRRGSRKGTAVSGLVCVRHQRSIPGDSQTREHGFMANEGTIQFRLPPNALRELAALAKYAERLTEIKENLTVVGPTHNVDGLARLLSERMDIARGDLRSILKGLLNLAEARRNTRLSPDQLFDQLTDTLSRETWKNWDARDFERWKASKEQISSAVEWASSDETLAAQREIQDLTYSRQNILTSARLIPDFRPVYDPDNSKIVHIIISYSLLISYSDGDGSKRIELALDATDVADLRRSCERVQANTVVAKETLKSLSAGVSVPGDVGIEIDANATQADGGQT
jgi:hypothetical protein